MLQRLAFAALCATVLAFAALLPPATPPRALAGTVTNQRPLLFTFDGADASGGRFSESPNGVTSVAVDNETEAVYVAAAGFAEGGGFVSKFNPDGKAEVFSTTGESSLFGFTNLLGVAVDNSGRLGYQGDLLVSQFGEEKVSAFDRGGGRLWSFLPPHQGQDLAIDYAGRPWVPGEGGVGGSPVVEYANSGAPPAPTGCTLPVETSKLDLDAAGNVYLLKAGAIRKYTPESHRDESGCTFSESTFDPSATNVYVNQSTTLPSPAMAGHIFTVENGSFTEYTPAGTELSTYGAGYLGAARAIAYNPTKDWVYVAERNLVAVFGPPASGTVPDASEATATLSGEEIATAHLSGKVNPQGTEASWHFEWKKSGQAWDEAGKSPAQTLPVDSTEHAASFDTDSLRGNTTWEVRLVGVNTANNLAGFSNVVTLTTKQAPAPPEITDESLSAITTTSATANAEINPKGDTAEWRLEVQRRCEGAWERKPLQAIAHATTSPVAVHYDLTGLLPSEKYCLRIWAKNSAGATTKPSGTEAPFVLNTETAPPSHVETAFAAPRLDTSARLNGYADPEGEVLTYRFEVSEDGGATWRSLKDHEDKSEARGGLLLSEELSGLTPGTTYSYRLAAENPVDAGLPVLGAVKTFTTRSTEEVEGPPTSSCPNKGVRAAQHSTYLPDCRAYELVSSPDKGNQNVRADVHDLEVRSSSFAPTTADGERAVWEVLGGTPEAPNGTFNAFLAARSGPSASFPNGWTNQPIAPPADQQLGGGGYGYQTWTATPDLTHFFATAGVNLAGQIEPSLLRLDDARHQEVLTSCAASVCIPSGGVNVTNDGVHVVGIDNPQGVHPASFVERLYDVGSGAPELLSLMPEGQSDECPVTSNTAGGYYGYSGNPWHPGEISGYDAIATTNASRVFFEAQPNGSGCTGPAALYVRNRESGHTILLDPGTGGRQAEFIRTTPDGRQAYYLTYSNCRRYDSQSGACEEVEAADANTTPDLYRWDEEEGASRCLTCGIEDEAGETVEEADVFGGAGDVRISDDFSHVYFDSTKQLVPGRGRAGDVNLYVLSGDVVRFVADPNDSGGNLGGTETNNRLSHDGKVLVFEIANAFGAHQQLTTDPLSTTCKGSHGAVAGCPQLYRYDDKDQSLECLSCRHGLTTTHRAEEVALSGDGSTVAFKTEEALVPQDVNNGVDLYERRNGAVHLLTNGVSEFPTAVLAGPRFGAVDDTGRNVFFTVAAPGGLTGFEHDGNASLYDAREGGGWLPPSEVAHCSEDSCQGPLQAAPSPNSRTSAVYHGPGNLLAGPARPRCHRGRVRHHGRCIKPHRRKRHQAKHRRGK